MILSLSRYTNLYAYTLFVFIFPLWRTFYNNKFHFLFILRLSFFICHIFTIFSPLFHNFPKVTKVDFRTLNRICSGILPSRTSQLVAILLCSKFYCFMYTMLTFSLTWSTLKPGQYFTVSQSMCWGRTKRHAVTLGFFVYFKGHEIIGHWFFPSKQPFRYQ
jgi:hypothetical protein